MKGLFLTAALGMVCVSAFAQGTLNFANAGVGFQAGFFDSDRVTGLSGTAWSADLFWAAGVVTDSTLLLPLNEPTTFSTIPSQAGYFFGGVRTVPTAPGVITAQIRVWDTAAGSEYVWALQSQIAYIGESTLFPVTLANPNATPPGIPASLTGLGHPQVPWSVRLIPEPSTLALAGLGFAAVLVLRRFRSTD